MMYYIKLSVILLLICAIASGILAYVNSVTAPRIAALKAEEAIKSRQELIPGCEFTEVPAQSADDFAYFVALNKETNELAGYTMVASKNGYSGKVQTMVGLDKDLRIIAIKVVEQSETPGLGANCTLPSFTEQFRGKTGDEMVVDKDGGKLRSLTGATITTRTIAMSLKEQIMALRKKLEANAGGIQ